MSIFYAGELNPVAAKAQKKVPVPEGLDLEAWINDPPLETEDEAEEDEEDEESDDEEEGYNELVQRTPSPSDKNKKKKTKKQKEKKRRKKSKEEEEYDVEQARQNRLMEQSMNPNYLKVRFRVKNMNHLGQLIFVNLLMKDEGCPSVLTRDRLHCTCSRRLLRRRSLLRPPRPPWRRFLWRRWTCRCSCTSRAWPRPTST